MSSLRLIFFISLQIFFLGQVIAANYEIILDFFEILLGDDDQMFENVNFRVKKFNRSTYVGDGVLKLKRSLDDSIKAGFKAYNLAGGQYKLMFQGLLGPPCDVIYNEHMRSCVEHFFQATNMSYWKWGLCPIEATTAYIKNYAPTEIGDHIPPYVPGGEKWKLELYFADNNTNILGGVNVYGILRTNYSLLNYGG